MTQDLHSLAAPYALDALDAHERSRFESHLDQCPDCRDELAGFVATATRLGDAVAVPPPPSLRDHVLTTAAGTPQERPTVVALTPRDALRRRLPSLVAAAALLVGGVGVGAYVVEHQRAEEAVTAKEHMTAVLAAADAETLSKAFDDGGSVRMVMSASEDAAVVFAKDLPVPDDDQVYQVWMIADGAPRSEGTFTRSGSMYMKGLSQADALAITIEPKGGSDAPTSDPVATIPV